MTESRWIADLPRLRVDIVRRDFPDENARTISIQMTATPSFSAMGEALIGRPAPVSPLALFAPINPVAAWMSAAQLVMSPWLALFGMAANPTGQLSDQSAPGSPPTVSGRNVEA